MDFSFVIKKYITGGQRSKLAHALKDTVGILNRTLKIRQRQSITRRIKSFNAQRPLCNENTMDKLGEMSGELMTTQQMGREVLKFHQQWSNE